MLSIVYVFIHWGYWWPWKGTKNVVHYKEWSWDNFHCLSVCLFAAEVGGLGWVWVGRRNNWWSPSPFFTATACHVTTQPPQFRLQCFAIHLKSGDMDSGNFFCQKFGKNMKKNKVWKFSTLLVLTTKTSLRFLFSCKCNESEIFWVESRFTERPWNLLRLNNWLVIVLDTTIYNITLHFKCGTLAQRAIWFESSAMIDKTMRKISSIATRQDQWFSGYVTQDAFP